MAINVKVTIFFESGKYGWSESYWTVGGDALPDPTADPLPVLYADAAYLSLLRMSLMGQGVTSPGIRISDDQNLRDSYFYPYKVISGEAGSPGTIITKTNVDLPPDQPYSSVLVRMYSGPSKWRMAYLRGLPDSIIVNPPGPLQPKPFASAFREWATYLTGLNQTRRAFPYHWRSHDKVAEPPIKITKISNNPVNGTITLPAYPFRPYSRVRIARAKGYQLPKGIFTVVPITLVGGGIDPNNFSLAEWQLPVTYVTGGTAQALSAYAWPPITSVVIVGETHRNTGRPFDSPRGRRIARR